MRMEKKKRYKKPNSALIVLAEKKERQIDRRKMDGEMDDTFKGTARKVKWKDQGKASHETNKMGKWMIT